MTVKTITITQPSRIQISFLRFRMMKNLRSTLVTDVFTGLVKDVRAAKHSEGVGGHFTNSSIRMLKKVRQSRRRKDFYSIPACVHRRLLRRHPDRQLGIVFKDIVTRQFKESVRRRASNEKIG